MQTINQIIDESVLKHPDDIDQACKCAARRLARHPEKDAFVRDLFKKGLQSLIYERRCEFNVQLKRSANGAASAKIVAVDSAVANEVARSWCDYFISGRSLGNLLGNELESLAQNEAERAAGHTFNRRLLEELKPLVPGEKTVREAVGEKRLTQIVERLRKREAA